MCLWILFLIACFVVLEIFTNDAIPLFSLVHHLYILNLSLDFFSKSVYFQGLGETEEWINELYHFAGKELLNMCYWDFKKLAEFNFKQGVSNDFQIAEYVIVEDTSASLHVQAQVHRVR